HHQRPRHFRRCPPDPSLVVTEGQVLAGIDTPCRILTSCALGARIEATMGWRFGWLAHCRRSLISVRSVPPSARPTWCCGACPTGSSFPRTSSIRYCSPSPARPRTGGRHWCEPEQPCWSCRPLRCPGLGGSRRDRPRRLQAPWPARLGAPAVRLEPGG